MDSGANGDTISAELERSCAEEPIHLLGTVQSYGFLMVVDPSSSCILQVPAGIVRHWPGLDDASTLAGTPLSDWVAGAGASDTLSVESLPTSHSVVLPWRPRFEHTSAAGTQLAASRWECLGHRCGELALLEWLPVDGDIDEPGRQNQAFGDFAEVVARLRHADGLGAFLDESVQVIQEFSAFDRVMIYRFLPDGCGEVVAEHTGKGLQRKYLGLRFPASDIPSQARALYLTNKLRVLADVEAAMDPLVPPTLPNGALLDQSHCILRGLSPVHLSYLRNMGVRATLTLSDRWVMRSAIAEQARWRTQGMPSMPVSINLSTVDILSPNLVAYLTQLLRDYQVPPAALEIEVTESCIMRELASTQSVLQDLNDNGICTALDDFGTGFSSLSYLRQLPLQCLKIDQSFTHSMLQDPNAETLTEAIVAMGLALKMVIVAEGVETREQMNWLRAHGCHIGQGYFFSPPVPPEDVYQVIDRIEVRLTA